MKTRYGHSHPIMRRITYDNSWSSHSQPSDRDMHIIITMSHHFTTWTFCDLIPGSCAPTRPDQSTDPSMRMGVLMSNMIKSCLITIQ